MKRKICLFQLFAIFLVLEMVAQHPCVNCDQIRYSGPGLKQAGWVQTRHSKDIKSSFWSVGCETLDRDYADFNVYKNYVGELGVKRARLQSGWAKCEKTKGVYDFAWLDVPVNGLVAQSVEPWINLSYGNPLYNAGHTLGSKIFTDEETMNAWLKYVEATVNRYKDRVKDWEIWNEPNLRNGGYEEYANLLMRTAPLIRKLHPEGKIIGFVTAGVRLEWSRKVFEILEKNGKLDIIDYLCYHPYDYNPDTSYENVAKLEALVKEYNPKIKLFQGEVGCPAILEFEHALPKYAWTEISQAKWFLRRMSGDLTRNIPTSIFTLIDLKYPNMLQSFGLIRSNLLQEIIYKRPSYYAVQHMVSFFDDTVKSLGQQECTSTGHRKLSASRFEKDGKASVLLWYGDRVPGDELRWDLEGVNLGRVNFKDPVYVDMLSGKVFEIGGDDWRNNGENARFDRLPVWDGVIMIAERELVTLRK